MEKVTKKEVIALMAKLRAKGYKREQLAVALDRSVQTIWAWSSDNELQADRMPCKTEYDFLNNLLGGS